ncbi:MAG TPA: GNAT family N-acetyltransferase [Chitinophagaceae bacterium]|nr:GNAT family N-acetyltransferase [Chitinophagaceae bacterium]
MTDNPVTGRNATINDFDLTYSLKERSTKHLIEKIWGWDNNFQLDYHKSQFDPNKTKIIVKDNKDIGYISVREEQDRILIENIIIDPCYQAQGIGTIVLSDLIKKGRNEQKNIELQVLRINTRAKSLYDRLKFDTFEQTDLHFKMRYTNTSGI